MANRTTYTSARATLAGPCDEVAETREPYIIDVSERRKRRVDFLQARYHD